jgi:hypothetical protein
MKKIILLMAVFSISSIYASDKIKTEICTAFAKEYSGQQGEEYYEHDNVEPRLNRHLKNKIKSKRFRK